MRRPLRGLVVASALAVAPAAACRSTSADDQALRDLGVTSTTAAATTTAGRAPRPDEDGPPTTRRATTTSSAEGTTVTSDGTGSSALTELTGDVAAACDALRTVTELDRQARAAQPSSLADVKAQLAAQLGPTVEAYGRAIAAVGPATPAGRELTVLRDATERLIRAVLGAATLEAAADLTSNEPEATAEAAGATFALNDAVKASCGFPLSAQLG